MNRVTRTLARTDGQVRCVRVVTAVGEDGRRVDERTWRRIERSLADR